MQVEDYLQIVDRVASQLDRTYQFKREDVGRYNANLDAALNRIEDPDEREIAVKNTVYKDPQEYFTIDDVLEEVQKVIDFIEKNNK